MGRHEACVCIQRCLGESVGRRWSECWRHFGKSKTVASTSDTCEHSHEFAVGFYGPKVRLES